MERTRKHFYEAGVGTESRTLRTDPHQEGIGTKIQ
jgi:hypothetical protein